MMKFIKNFLTSLSYVFFPKICFYCQKPLEIFYKLPLCETCIKQIKFIKGLICQKCGLPLYDGGAHCYNCRTSKRKLYFEFIRSPVEYKEPIKTLIHEFKYQGKHFLTNFLITLISQWWEKNSKLFPQLDIVCCVPMNSVKQFLRGYNQAELLAYNFAKIYNFNFQPQLLKRTKLTVSQFKLTREQRLINVKDAFEINKKFVSYVKGKNILIIDDVCTTGETINQCAKVLKKSGAKNVYGLVLARDV